MMKVAVITALWYEDKFLSALLSSLEKVDYPATDWEIIMIDNKNSPVTKKWFADNVFPKVGKTLPKTTLLETKNNLGFAGGNNACAKLAKDRGCEAVYLLNEDARVEPGFLKEAVARMAKDANIAAVQSFLVLDGPNGGMNSIGNQFHFLGFSYCGGYKMSRHDAEGYMRVRRLADPDLNIAAASGAAVLVRLSDMDAAGYLDESYHMYHEDLDLSLRLREAGRKIVIEPASVVYHAYEFGRSIDKFYWMERNRFRLLLEHYKLATFLVLLPALVLSELGLLVFGALGGTLRARVRVYAYVFDMRNWAEIGQKRERVQAMRKIGDRELLKSAVSGIAFQEVDGPAMKIVNQLMSLYWKLARSIIRW